MDRDAPWIAVCGPGEDVAEDVLHAAEEVGAGVAAAGAVLVCGGLGGVMEAACRGAKSRRGSTVGFLPGEDREAANGWIDFPLPTGLGELRNGLIVRACDALIAVSGGPGTLSEIALALKTGKPVVGLGSWSLGDAAGLVEAGSAAEAVERAFALLSQNRR